MLVITSDGFVAGGSRRPFVTSANKRIDTLSNAHIIVHEDLAATEKAQI